MMMLCTTTPVTPLFVHDYFIILLFYYFIILLFYYFIILLFYLLFYYFICFIHLICLLACFDCSLLRLKKKKMQLLTLIFPIRFKKSR
jgi:hypothetical protein